MDPKPGYKTTEFWMTVVSAVVSILIMSGVVGEGSDLMVTLASLQTFLATSGYTVIRGSVKKKTLANSQEKEKDGPQKIEI